jgi:hypothetical protein
MSSNAALGLWLDCVSTAFVAAVTFSFIMLHECKLLVEKSQETFKDSLFFSEYFQWKRWIGDIAGDDFNWHGAIW